MCCKHVDRVPSLRGLADETGRCKYLDEHNLCSIYEHRPKVCNVAWIYEHFFKEHVSEEEFYARTSEACDKLRNEVISSKAVPGSKDA